MFMIGKSKQHLLDSGCGYFEHCKFAIYAGVLLSTAGIASFIHAVFPALFQGTSAHTVIKLYHQRLKNHPNQIYQQWIKDESNNQENTSS